MEKLDTFEGKKRKADYDLTDDKTRGEIKKNKKKEKKEKKNKNQNKNKITNDGNNIIEENLNVKNQNWNMGKNFDPKRDLKSEKFEEYYRSQLGCYFEDENQFQLFIDKLREKLPCIFRMNTAHPFWKQFRDILIDQNLVKNLLDGEDYGIKISPKYLTNLPEWKDLIFTINIPRMELKRNETLSKFHKFIQRGCDAGLISRQEAVSMIPPILMGVSKTDKIFDMCAAPGSKTAQFLEVLYRDYNFLDPNSIEQDTGFVLANDNNWNRAYMMIHQLKRLNTAGMVVISHDAQFFPTIYKEENDDRIMFDKILADVPCSSDAVLRKLPHKWKKWSPKDSFSLHKLQLQILKRGISILKLGGTMIYSTCSLNPIENEAVVCEVMKSYPGCLEIVDMSYSFTGSDIRCRPGLLNWKVFADDLNDKTNKKLVELKNKSDPLYLSTVYKEYIEESCFPPEDEEISKNFKLNNCIRLFPHDSDTSGFFITLIKKINPISYGSEKSHKDRKPVNPDKGIQFICQQPEITNWLQNYYGLNFDLNEKSNPRFPSEQLITSSKIFKKINFISKGVMKLLNSDKRNQLSLINVGVKLFSLNKSTIAQDNVDYCKYRICQDGLIYLIPFMTKRIFFCSQNFFITVLSKPDVLISEIEDIKLKEDLKSVKSGCAVLVCVKEKPDDKNGFIPEYYLPYLQENYIDAVCCYTSAVRLSTMINKEHQFVFNIKYNIPEKQTK